MDRIHGVYLLAVALIMLIVELPVEAFAQQVKSHPGVVVELGTRRPLAVDIKAWPETQQSGKQGDCPLFGRAPLDATRSFTSGEFQLGIDNKHPTYTVTYCAEGYYPRADRDLRNELDRSPVIPRPVELHRRGASSGLYADAVSYKTLALLNDLAYLNSINPSQFLEVVQLVSKGSPDEAKRQQLLKQLFEIISQWGQ